MGRCIKQFIYQGKIWVEEEWVGKVIKEDVQELEDKNRFDIVDYQRIF